MLYVSKNIMNNNKESSSSSPMRTEGCAGCGCVLTVGMLLSLLGLAIGGGCSVRIPGTESNITLAGSVGSKAKTELVLPAYSKNLIGDNTNFINQTHSLTIGPAQGTELFIVGRQPGSPPLDLQLDLK